MILITGGSGKTGMAVTHSLSQHGVAVRAFVRRPEQVDGLRCVGAREAIVGDLRNREDLLRACTDIDALYHICPNMQPDEVAIGQNVLSACQQRDVARLVYHSVLHPQTEEMPHHWHKLRMEELIFKSSLDYTIVQPAAYMQNILAGWQAIVTEGAYRVPYAVTTRLGMVDLADVAAAVATILTEAGHSGATYELCGSEVLTQREVAMILSEVLDRPVQAEQIATTTWEQDARTAGLPDYAITTLLKMFDYYERYGFWGNARALTTLLGRKPTTLRECVQRQLALLA